MKSSVCSKLGQPAQSPHPTTGSTTREPRWWTLVKRHCSIEPASALHFNELTGERGQLHTRHLLQREKAGENSFHASWLLKKPHLRRLRHMYVINSKCTLISLKEPYKVFQFQLKRGFFGERLEWGLMFLCLPGKWKCEQRDVILSVK